MIYGKYFWVWEYVKGGEREKGETMSPATTTTLLREICADMKWLSVRTVRIKNND